GATVVGEVGAHLPDPDPVGLVVLELEAQLALEERVRGLELPHHEGDAATAEIGELEVRVLQPGDLAALAHVEVEVIAHLVRDRAAAEELDAVGRLEVEAGASAGGRAPGLHVRVDAEGEVDALE